MSRIVTALLVLVFGMVAIAWWLTAQLNSGSDPAGPQSANTESSEPLQNPSLAVLPFSARSVGQEHGRLFADGLHEELLKELARAPGLRVIARESIAAFRNTAERPAEIGQALGVSHLLTGEVQEVGARIRFVVRLVGTSSEQVAWSENYDRATSVRSLEEIRVQIVQTVLERLGTDGIEDTAGMRTGPPSGDLEAYRAVLVSGQLARRRSPTSLETADKLARQAISLDPGYAEAHLALARAGARQVARQLTTDAERGEAVLASVGRALELAPDHPAAWALQGEYLLSSGRPGAMAALERALLLEPGNAHVAYLYGRALQESGRPDRALPQLRFAADRNPLSPRVQLALGRTHSALADFENARHAFDRALDLDPDSPLAYRPHSATYMAEGKLDEALFWAVRTQELTPRDPVAGAWVLFLNDCLEDYSASGRWSDWLNGQVTNQAVPLAMLARHDFLTGRFESAIQRSNLALRLTSPDDPVADAIFMRIKRDEALALGDPEGAIRLFRERRPELFDSPASLSAGNVQQAVDLAQLMQMAGWRDEAALLLEAVIAWYDQPFAVAGNDRSWLVPVRAEALAVLGEHQQALSELRRIIDSGWRVFWRWETDLNFNFNGLRQFPEYREMIRELAEDMARQRRQARAMSDLGGMAPPASPNG